MTLIVWTFTLVAVLFVADRLALGRERGSGVGGALAHGGPPLVALVTAMR